MSARAALHGWLQQDTGDSTSPHTRACTTPGPTCYTWEGDGQQRTTGNGAHNISPKCPRYNLSFLVIPKTRKTSTRVKKTIPTAGTSPRETEAEIIQGNFKAATTKTLQQVTQCTLKTNGKQKLSARKKKTHRDPAGARTTMTGSLGGSAAGGRRQGTRGLDRQWASPAVT